MPSDKKLIIYKIVIGAAGGLCLICSLFNLQLDVLNAKALLILFFALLITSRLTLSIPHSESHLSFADTMIFLVFLLFGPEAAIIFGVLEMLVNCSYLIFKGVKFGRFTVLFNIFSTALSSFLTFSVVHLLQNYSHLGRNYEQTSTLFPVLSVLALSQFLFSSLLASFFYSLKNQTSLWFSWKRVCFSSSMTQIVGAGIAGVAFKILNYGDLLTSVMALIFFAITYLYYKQSINDINESVVKAERAQREKAESETKRRKEAERYAEKLADSLSKEEEVSEALRQSKTELEHAAFHDFLTDLPNRTYLVERLRLLIEIGIEISHKYYVLFLDLSRFQNINDRLGHTVGDRVLQLVAKRLVSLLRDGDTVARLGGDEFAIVLTDVSSIETAQLIAKQIHEKLSMPFYLQGHKIYTDLNIGIAPFDADHEKPEDLLRDADIAMHHAKETGRGVSVFTMELRGRFLERITLEAELRFALEREELFLNYQPIVSLKTGKIIGFEALLRWQHRDKKLISPAQFIPIAEDNGLIIPMTRWILNETCRNFAKWQKAHKSRRKVSVSVNISGKHLLDENLVTDVSEALVRSGLPASCLTLEITESIAMDHAERTIEILSKLKRLGVKLSIDDFGTGYSSLNYLHRLPFDTLKIDRSFVNEVGEHGENSEILQTIIQLAKNLGMKVVAEGVETHSQFSLLRNLRCEYGQGFLMSKPVSEADAEMILRSNRDWSSLILDESHESREKTLQSENLPIF
ncbi:MAG: EAL domain-containing protein [Pyrinomonadaceae bacterium]|nr:EAL domain-containing protein [Pyrinomonadaceae bacterium]